MHRELHRSDRIGWPFRGILLAATILTLFASSSLSADKYYAEAAKWYRKAAEQGDVDATRILGLAYYLGKWVPQDFVQSYFWFSLAASRASGDEYQQASEAKERVAKELTPEKLKVAQGMVKEWEKSHPRK